MNDISEEDEVILRKAASLICGGAKGVGPNIMSEYMIFMARQAPQIDQDRWAFCLRGFAEILMVIYRLFKA